MAINLLQQQDNYQGPADVAFTALQIYRKGTTKAACKYIDQLLSSTGEIHPCEPALRSHCRLLDTSKGFYLESDSVGLVMDSQLDGHQRGQLTIIKEETGHNEVCCTGVLEEITAWRME
jgi:hypothetical protein